MVAELEFLGDEYTIKQDRKTGLGCDHVESFGLIMSCVMWNQLKEWVRNFEEKFRLNIEFWELIIIIRHIR